MTAIFGKELSPTVAALVYVFLVAALLILIASIWYYWSYARKIERFLERDNENNNMMRQDLVDSFVERGEQEWTCSICFHDNHPSKNACVMCGTPSVVGSRSPSIARASGLRKADLVRMNSSILTQQSRVRSFHVRRLKQMNLTSRQKAAMRRHLWRRKKGADGRLHWVRIDQDEDKQGYDEITTPKSERDSEASMTDSMRATEAHIALALRDFGEADPAERPPRPSRFFQPLRATALKNLEQAEERPTMFHNQLENPYNEMSKMELGLGGIDEEDEQDRRDNATAISTGYVRHENEEGEIDWAPANGVDISAAAARKIECDDDLEEIAALTFLEKTKWFLEQVQKRWRSYDQGHIQFVVRREHLVADSMEQMLKCPASRFWERLRIYFENEPGLDAGGLIREWFECLSDGLFNDDFGLFIATKGENMGYWINPASESKLGKDHLQYYEFVGRLLGKALIEGHNMKMSLALPLIKHILEVPISFSDLEFLDEELYKNALWMKQNDHAELLAIDFTVQVITSEGKSETIELVPGGKNIDVTDSNKKQYLELLLKHYMFGSIAPQLTALLRGFYDIVPQFLVTVFDYQEFDLLLSGVPDINVGDWRTYSEVRWIKLEKPTPAEQRVIDWFWDTLANFTSEEKARLLQFTTGTSRVPVQGFKALTSADGRVRRFTIQVVQRGAPPTGLLPKGHTCFNRIDLPLYGSIEELEKYLTLVINMEISGFWLE
jgi:E3 ubiquitin ligase SMURF1/2